MLKQTLGFGAVLGSVGDLRRATSGGRATEPKQIGDGTQDGTEPLTLYLETWRPLPIAQLR